MGKQGNAFKWTRLIALAIFIILGVIISGHLDDVNYARASENWNEVDAFIFHSSIRYGDSDAWPVIEYRYTVDGIQYESNDIWVGGKEPMQMTLNATQSMLNDYPVGGNAIAYYDPDNPEDSALIIGVQNAHLQPFLLDFGGLMVGLSVLAVGKSLYKSSIPKPVFDSKLNSNVVSCTYCNNKTFAGSQVCNYCGKQIFARKFMIFENLALLVFVMIGLLFTLIFLGSAFGMLYIGYVAVFEEGMSPVFTFLGVFGFTVFLGFTYGSMKVTSKIWNLLTWKANLTENDLVRV